MLVKIVPQSPENTYMYISWRVARGLPPLHGGLGLLVCEGLAAVRTRLGPHTWLLDELVTNPEAPIRARVSAVLALLQTAIAMTVPANCALIAVPTSRSMAKLLLGRGFTPGAGYGGMERLPGAGNEVWVPELRGSNKKPPPAPSPAGANPRHTTSTVEGPGMAPQPTKSMRPRPRKRKSGLCRLCGKVVAPPGIHTCKGAA